MVVLLSSCSKKEDQATYDLHIGNDTLKMPIKPSDIRDMEAVAVKEIMVLWDNLDEGKSNWFSYSVTRPWGDVQRDMDGVVAIKTTGSGKWRFFKHPNGEFGIENETNPIATSTNLDRRGVAELVRSNLNKFEPIIQNQ